MNDKKLKTAIVLLTLAGTSLVALAPTASADWPTPCGYDTGLPPPGTDPLGLGNEPCENSAPLSPDDPNARGDCGLRLLGAPSTPVVTPEDHRTGPQLLDLFCRDPRFSISDLPGAVSEPRVTSLEETSDGLLGTGVGNTNPALPGVVSFMRLPAASICPQDTSCTFTGQPTLSPEVRGDVTWTVMVNSLSSFRVEVCVDVLVRENSTGLEVVVTTCIRFGQTN